MTEAQHDLPAVLKLRDEFVRRDTRIVGITIAKIGSRRFPQNNIVPVCGRPLVEWSLLQCLTSHLVTDTYLSTDSEEIAKLGRRMGAKIIWRYEVGHDIPDNLPFAHAIRQIREDHPIDLAVMLLPTNPVRHPWDIDEAVRLFWELRKTDRGAHELIQLVPQLETIIHKKLDDCRSQVLMGDKHCHYLDAAGAAWNIADPDWYLRYADTAPASDAEINADWVNVYDQNIAFTGRNFLYYILGEHYQRFDLDLPEQLGVIEDMMKRYILTTPDVYERYKSMAAKEAEKEQVLN